MLFIHSKAMRELHAGPCHLMGISSVCLTNTIGSQFKIPGNICSGSTVRTHGSNKSYWNRRKMCLYVKILQKKENYRSNTVDNPKKGSCVFFLWTYVFSTFVHKKSCQKVQKTSHFPHVIHKPRLRRDLVFSYRNKLTRIFRHHPQACLANTPSINSLQFQCPLQKPQFSKLQLQ